MPVFRPKPNKVLPADDEEPMFSASSDYGDEPVNADDGLSGDARRMLAWQSFVQFPNLNEVEGEFMFQMPRTRPAYEMQLVDPTDIIQTYMVPGGREIGTCFQVASQQPPITLDSLTELDMPRIINNPKLRHDINFDRELYFRPNLDGSRGQEKMKAAEDYWKALEGELFMYRYVHEKMKNANPISGYWHWTGVLLSSTQRLPVVFAAIRDILKSLVPDNDQQSIADKLDVDFIMQELKNGVCDLVDLGNWLSTVLKNHCAPMRDPLVNAMRFTIIQGAEENNPSALVSGIRQLLSILETMKLDVANHQIRHMRTILIEDTVNFEQRYNAHRISIGRIDKEQAREWFEMERTSMEYTYREARPLEALTGALLRGLIDPEYQEHPKTFYLDEERLSMLRAEILYPVYVLCCRDVFLEMAQNSNASSGELTMATNYLARHVRTIVGNSSNWDKHLEALAVLIMRIILRLERRDERVDAMLLSWTEDRLMEDMRPESVCFQRHAQDVFDRLNPKIVESVERNVNLNALMLQDKLVPQTPPVPFQTQPFAMGATMAPPPAMAPPDPDEDIVRRFTHILVLHWHVWGDLVYQIPERIEGDDAGLSNGSNHPPPGPQLPTVPVSQAVYSPGRKWLPIAITTTEVPTGLPTPSPTITGRSLSPTPVDIEAMPRGSEGPGDDDEGPSEVSGFESEGHYLA